MNKINYSKIGLGTLLVGIFSGCVAEGPYQARVYAPPPPVVRVEPAVVVQDDYVYYPGYQVYYSNTRRQYIYQEGRTWVTRPSPPRVSVDVLFASPSVRLDFHDSPERHHATVVRQYPRHWEPSGRGPNRRDNDRRDDDDDRGRKGRE
jgi:hypothetical protein